MDAYWVNSKKEQCFYLFQISRLQPELAVACTYSRAFPSQEVCLSVCLVFCSLNWHILTQSSPCLFLLKPRGKCQPSIAVASIHHEGKTPMFSSSVLMILFHKTNWLQTNGRVCYLYIHGQTHKNRKTQRKRQETGSYNSLVTKSNSCLGLPEPREGDKSQGRYRWESAQDQRSSQDAKGLPHKITRKSRSQVLAGPNGRPTTPLPVRRASLGRW